MSKLHGEVLTLPKVSGSVSTPKSLSGNVGAKTINIGGKGDDGATFIPSVSVGGVISWTNDKDLPNPEPVNIKGAKGDKGEQGERGLQGIQGIQGERGEQGLKGDKGDRGEQGAQGLQGPKGETGPAGPQGNAGADGKPGKDGIDGKDGFSPVVSVVDIEGGHRVTITDKDGNKTFDVMDGKDGEAVGGGGGIIDVIELPTENIDETAFYRLMTATWVYNQAVAPGYICHCVENLPEVGEPATDADMTIITSYYNVSDGIVYGYIESTLSAALGVPVGWYDIGILLAAVNVSYGGVISDMTDALYDDKLYVFAKSVIYNCLNGNWTDDEKVGWTSTDINSVIFNDAKNIAGTFALAGGRDSAASGEAAFAFGIGVNARSFGSFVHGQYNIVDPYGNNASIGRYAHAVGNGTSEMERSNAHTLDWNGLGWFAGGLKVGGTGQDDENAVAVLTAADTPNIIAQVIAALPIYNGEVEEV